VKRLIGVGVGPGDPELVTVKAVRVLREADVVLVPVLTTEEPGRAETIVKTYVPADRIRRLEFALNDTGGVTPRRAAAWHAAATAVAEEFSAGAATVAFGTLGDPNLYSTFSYLAQTVRDLVPEVTVETVAGITAMQDLASRAGLSLAEGAEPVTLIPLNGPPAALDQALAQGGTVVGYKVGAAASPAPASLRARLDTAGRLGGAVIGARLGLDGELIAPAAEALGQQVPYLSTLIVPAARSARGSSLAATPDQETPGREPGPAGRVVFVGAGPGAPDLLTEPTSSSGPRAWSTTASWPTPAPARRSSTRPSSPWKASCPTTNGPPGTSWPSPASTPATPPCGARSRSSSNSAANSAWTPRSCRASPASPRSPPPSAAS
jgi:precorrin-2/cobalt-factor-2 C20-methyltransferase